MVDVLAAREVEVGHAYRAVVQRDRIPWWAVRRRRQARRALWGMSYGELQAVQAGEALRSGWTTEQLDAVTAEWEGGTGLIVLRFPGAKGVRVTPTIARSLAEAIIALHNGRRL